MSKRTTITVSADILKEVQKMKKKYYDKSYSEIYRVLLQKGLEALNAEKTVSAERK